MRAAFTRKASRSRAAKLSACAGRSALSRTQTRNEINQANTPRTNCAYRRSISNSGKRHSPTAPNLRVPIDDEANRGCANRAQASSRRTSRRRPRGRQVRAKAHSRAPPAPPTASRMRAQERGVFFFAPKSPQPGRKKSRTPLRASLARDRHSAPGLCPGFGKVGPAQPEPLAPTAHALPDFLAHACVDVHRVFLVQGTPEANNLGV